MSTTTSSGILQAALSGVRLELDYRATREQISGPDLASSSEAGFSQLEDEFLCLLNAL